MDLRISNAIGATTGRVRAAQAGLAHLASMHIYQVPLFWVSLFFSVAGLAEAGEHSLSVNVEAVSVGVLQYHCANESRPAFLVFRRHMQ